MSLCTVIYELSVYFVGDDPEVVLLGDVTDESHVFHCENSSCRVARREAADGFCLRCDGSLYEVSLCPVITILCFGCERNEHAAYFVAECVVICVERLSDQSFVSRIENGCEREDESLGASIGDNDVLALILHVEVSLHVVDHCVAQFIDALGLSVCDDLLVKISYCFHEARRSLDIRLADVETIDFFAVFSLGFKSEYVESSDRRELHSCTSF